MLSHGVAGRFLLEERKIMADENTDVKDGQAVDAQAAGATAQQSLSKVP